MTKKLILFDIDGTLIEAGISAIGFLIEKHFGTISHKSEDYVEGATFRKILVGKLKRAGIEKPEEDPRFETAVRDSESIAKMIESGAEITKIPGVEDLILKLQNGGNVLGLLTGNSENVSKVKLEAVDLWKYFGVGAYGSETKVRSELVEIAIKNAKAKLGTWFDKNDIFLVGDTVVDIECAKEAGVKIIAVSTGKESFEMLEEGNPDFLFKDFSDVDAIVEAIEK